ncbi:hypothetical protein PLESTB_000179900 [Pleodorina starrii]|uniref:Cupin type-2 domain-containing protein n=1 Tax=Pleodorina starrii TaxID=330485 RepID=A0A9W6EXU7_9CHLO|nr:hypothetical protein PLESTM_000516800 [Pleodorina starrii]GLC49077.1 hypothetical protein PLESTB_000179900 [Pleodorina starrii]GLC66128.1 hypothetical protein PLESTF_000387900 [Pleodorina starrii]
MAYMSQNCHFGRTWRSCRGSRVHGTWKPLPNLCCSASLSTAAEQSRLPFGGAIVAKLAGSAKILKGGHHLVPLLGPGQRAAGQPELPFGASVECVRRSSQQDEQSCAPGEAASTARSGTLTGDADASASSRMLDVLYVLAGSGVATSADGTVRKLHSGDSLVAWHNTCELRAISADDQPPAVLKFHFPASVLMLPPGSVVAPSPSHADLQILVDDCRGAYDGELSPQEAADMLSGVQQRASRAIAHLYNHQTQQQYEEQTAQMAKNDHHEEIEPRSSSHAYSEQPRAADAAAAADAADAGAAPGTAVSAASNVVPFLRRLLRGAAAPAVGGVHLLRSALRRHRSDSAAAAATLTAAQAPLQHPPPGGRAGSLAGPVGPLGRVISNPQQLASASSSPASSSSGSGCVLLQRALEEFKAFRFPRQTNKLAFVFDPSELGLSLSFGVEVFEPGHHTPLHIHKSAHELFFVLAGTGLAVCNGRRFPVGAGDCVVFPPRAVHGIDNTSYTDKLYCLQLMTPNEAFVEHVKSGEAVGRLDDEDLCNLTSRHC